MKKLLLIIIASCSVLHVWGQAQDAAAKKKSYIHDRDLSRWVLDVNLLGGGSTQDFSRSGSNGYLNEIAGVSNNGSLSFRNGYTLGGDAQIGLFFGKKKHWGIGTGFMYLYQQGNVQLNNYSVQYQSDDANNVVFRQILTGDNVKEKVTSMNMNIPLVLKYKNRFSKHWGFTGDIGALFNVQMKNGYNNNGSSFNYEAIYAYETVAGVRTPYFDANPTPATGDLLLTRSYLQDHYNGSFAQTVTQAQAGGANIGFGIKPTSSTGSQSYTTGSVGILLQPSVNYFFSDKVALNLGVYYIYQPFKNDAQSNYTLSNKLGDYNTILNNVSSSNAQSYGINVGLRFFLGKEKGPNIISAIDSMAPSLCGNCDGAMTLHGFKKGKKVVVNYNYNGAPQTPYESKADEKGDVMLKGLCAGSYTGITAKIKHKTFTGYPVNIVAPALTITAENPTNPTANGICDGTISFDGLYAGKPVTISYTLNGSPQQPYNGVVKQDGKVVITGLCDGVYSNVVASVNTCSANGSNVTLTAPPPPPPPPAPDTVPQRPDVSIPILFNLNKSTVHKSSLPLLKEAAAEMNGDPAAVITVNGYTDARGTKAYNKKLSVKRAQAVKNDLKKFGVSSKRVKIVGHGKSDPAATNKTPEGRAKNRRAVMDLEDKK